ncbi:MAG: anthranilate synthase component I family protein [Clostridiales Family XIII bacterium]|jgi:anthranilate synthase component 1|nr:anthranilate synthase component I family protein [Clostridiales Family XIII bacterium]
MIKPTLEEARGLAAGHTLIPIAMELFADLKTPVEVLKSIQAGGREAYLLESAESNERWGRHTFLGYDPVMEISGTGRGVVLKQGGVSETREGDPHRILKEIAGAHKSPRVDSLPPFTGGFVGYFAYEYIAHIEKTLRLTGNDDVGFDDFRLMMFDKVIAFDHFRQKIFLIVNIETADLERNYIRGVTLLKDMEQRVLSPAPASAPTGSPMSPASPPSPEDLARAAADAASSFTASLTKEAFYGAVEKAKWHIREGDIFQCVPSLRFRTPFGGDLLQAYRTLRITNPSAYMFYIRFSDLQLAGASPETLVSLKDSVVSTYPLAGTCVRTEDEAENEIRIRELLNDEKELSEHDMLVDLGRNDLGKVCRFGSVKVDEYRSIKKLSHVCHIASKVTGEIAEGFGALDVMAAVLPAGTLSGAPKKRACEIIDDIEGRKRGPYGGAIGYLDFTGNMDLCIGIRMAVLKNGFAYVQAGAGIVEGSVPEKEYAECMHKAGAMMGALAASGKGA